MSDTPEEKIRSDFDDTMQALRQAESILPDFTSSYDGVISRLYDEIVSRPAFQYDPLGDPLYRNYRTQMLTEGSRAMRDTAGEASALTGGYGSTYAQSLGQQQYAQYLERLGQVMPELYEAAYRRYRDEGEDLWTALNTARGLADSEVGRKQERFSMAADLEKQRYERGEKRYQKLLSLISQSGYVPSDEELQAAGMNRDQADALRNAWLLKNPRALTGYGLLTGAKEYGVSRHDWGGGGYVPSASGSGGSSEPGEKEQDKLEANKPGNSNTDKHRRL
ncbi:MAG: hypothetical protein IJQ36_07160 [Oscillospiraceae bacterium]|nr:hypothetical protein [Oscillospiraceae bacterium]